MKKLLLFASMAIAAQLGFMSFRTADVLTDTGVTQADIELGSLANLNSAGSFSFSTTDLMRRMAKRIPVGAQAATVRALGKVVRAYVESDAFKQAYRQSLQSRYTVDEAYSDDQVAQS